jgi:hypothetical protein
MAINPVNFSHTMYPKYASQAYSYYLDVPHKILCLKTGEYLHDMTFKSEEYALKYLLEFLHKIESENCHSFDQLKEFRSTLGIHMFDIVGI